MSASIRIIHARAIDAHGQMSATEVEERMSAFYDRKYDVLLSTSIVESGIDIPTANTLIVHRADMFGLAQLYQLRGRVGRSKARAYAYLTTPADQPVTVAITRHADPAHHAEMIAWIRAGSALADGAGQAMETIVASVRRAPSSDQLTVAGAETVRISVALADLPAPDLLAKLPDAGIVHASRWTATVNGAAAASQRASVSVVAMGSPEGRCDADGVSAPGT